MTESMKKRNRLLAERMIKALESRNMEAFYAETKEDALKKALELIPEGSSISWGGSMSIQEIGLTDAVKSGKYQVYERAAAKNPEEKRKIIRIFTAKILQCLPGTGNRISFRFIGLYPEIGNP